MQEVSLRAGLSVFGNRDGRLAQIQSRSSAYVYSLRSADDYTGPFLYAKNASRPVLYASVFAALALDIVGELETMTSEEKNSWAAYINGFQCEDGLYRDLSILNDIAETKDWWSWRHMTLLSLMALTALDSQPQYRLRWLDSLATPSQMTDWLNAQDWDQRVDYTSNAVQNWVAAMQYARDFLGEAGFAPVIDQALSFLTDRCNPETGLWGDEYPSFPQILTRQVQAAYHFWLLFAYDGIEIPYREKAICFVLATQGKYGGFSPMYMLSSACEDIDSIDPLVRFGRNDRQSEERVTDALRKSLRWVAYNFNKDGGAVFRRNAKFVHSHQLMASGKNESGVFATWSRLLSLALIDVCGAEAQCEWHFLDAPGYQIDPRKLFHNRAFVFIDAIPTHMTEQEKFFLYNLARKLDRGTDVLELGSYLGASTCCFAEGRRNASGSVFCVDTWRNNAMSEGARDTYDEFLRNTVPYNEIVKPLRGTTSDIAASFDREVGLLFIDADHSYGAVRLDLEHWLPKLRPGGWLLMHDWGWAAGVKRAIQEIVEPIQVGEPVCLPNLYAVRVASQERHR